MVATFTLDSCIRGYHVYKDIWDPVTGESLHCERKDRNPQDPYEVRLKLCDATVGHVQRIILCICMLFLRQGAYCKWSKAVFP